MRKGRLNILVNMPEIFARQIEELYAESIADYHISHQCRARNKINDIRHLKTETQYRTDGKHLPGLNKSPSDTQILQPLISMSENSVLSDPQLSR